MKRGGFLCSHCTIYQGNVFWKIDSMDMKYFPYISQKIKKYENHSFILYRCSSNCLFE